MLHIFSANKLPCVLILHKRSGPRSVSDLWLEKGFIYMYLRGFEVFVSLRSVFDCLEVTVCGCCEVKIQLLTPTPLPYLFLPFSSNVPTLKKLNKCTFHDRACTCQSVPCALGYTMQNWSISPLIHNTPFAATVLALINNAHLQCCSSTPWALT